MARKWWDPREVVKTAWDVTGADSAFKFGQNIGEGKFGDAARQVGRGVKTGWELTPGDEIWNISRDAGQAVSGQKSWSDVLGTIKRDLPGGFLDVLNVTPFGRGAMAAFRLSPLRSQAARIGKDIILGGMFAGANTKLEGPQKALATATPQKQPSAADFRMREEYYKSREKAQEAAGITPIVPNQPTTAPNVVSGTAPGAAPGGLVGLTPDQTYDISMQERELQRQYDELLNQLALAEKQAKANTASTRYGIQREAAGTGQDLATQLAAAGLDFSPASAIGAEQLVQGSRAQQESAAVKSLADFIAQLQQQRTQAAGDLRRNKLFLRGDIGRQQIANTIGNIDSYYGMLGGA